MRDKRLTPAAGDIWHDAITECQIIVHEIREGYVYFGHINTIEDGRMTEWKMPLADFINGLQLETVQEVKEEARAHDAS